MKTRMILNVINFMHVVICLFVYLFFLVRSVISFFMFYLSVCQVSCIFYFLFMSPHNDLSCIIP
eukprot:UN10456